MKYLLSLFLLAGVLTSSAFGYVTMPKNNIGLISQYGIGQNSTNAYGGQIFYGISEKIEAGVFYSGATGKSGTVDLSAAAYGIGANTTQQYGDFAIKVGVALASTSTTAKSGSATATVSSTSQTLSGVLYYTIPGTSITPIANYATTTTDVSGTKVSAYSNGFGVLYNLNKSQDISLGFSPNLQNYSLTYVYYLPI